MSEFAMVILAGVELVTLHQINGRVVEINPAQITQMLHPHRDGNKLVTKAVKCVIHLTDGSYLSVAETCENVRELMKETKP